MQRRSRANTVVLGLVLATAAACKETKEDAASAEAHDRGAQPDPDGDRTPTPKKKTKDPDPEAPPLLPPLELAALGARPGHVAGGLVYLSMRASPTQAWVKSLPWPSDALREAAEAAREIGFDPLAADWIEHFAIAEDAIVSATLMRPLDAGVADAQARMETIATGLDDDPGLTGEKIEEVAPPPGIVPPPTPTPGPSSATVDAVRTASRGFLKAAGHHSRVHLPSRDPARTRTAIVGMFKENDRTRGAEACVGVTGPSACLAESSGVIMLRELDDAVVVDLVMFAVSSTDGSPSQWKPTLEAALAEPSATIEHAASLAGDAAMWLDPAPLARLQALHRVGNAMSSAAWATDWPSDIAWELKRVRAFAPLAEAPRIFPGVQIEAVAQGKDLQARATWPVAGALWGRMGASMIATPPSPSPVPKIEALCDGAVICFRTQGIPDVRALAKSLATKGFSGDFEHVMRRLGRDEEFSFALVLAGGWANLLASGASFPESMSGTEAGIARTVRDAAMRAEGFGGSVRSLAMTGFFRFETDYVLYSRAQVGDVGAATGLLALSGEPTREVDLADGRGKATLLDTRAQSPRAQVLLRKDEGEATAGWIALADAPDRFSWLLSLPTETTEAPTAYLEFPDLLGLVAPMAGGDLEDMRGWLRSRRLRFLLDLSGGAPRLQASLTGPP
jgi:hypothetical protein